jgi:hypothetical protein
MFPPFFAGFTAPRLAFAVGGVACCVGVCEEGILEVDFRDLGSGTGTYV